MKTRSPSASLPSTTVKWPITGDHLGFKCTEGRAQGLLVIGGVGGGAKVAV